MVIVRPLLTGVGIDYLYTVHTPPLHVVYVCDYILFIICMYYIAHQ